MTSCIEHSYVPDKNGYARNRSHRPIGSCHPMTGLTEGDIRSIRLEYAGGNCTYRELASKYKLSEKSVGNIVNRLTWKHIP